MIGETLFFDRCLSVKEELEMFQHARCDLPRTKESWKVSNATGEQRPCVPPI